MRFSIFPNKEKSFGKSCFFIALFQAVVVSNSYSQKISTANTQNLNFQNPLANNAHLLSKLKLSNVVSDSSNGFDEFFLRTIVPEYLTQFLKSEANQDLLFSKLQSIQNENPSECSIHFGKLFEKLIELIANQTKILDPTNTWALHMIDSWGKLPGSGILSGHLNSYGDYDECVNVDVLQVQDEANHFEGQYCWAYLIPGVLESEDALQEEPKNQMSKTNNFTTKGAGTVPELIYHLTHPIGTFVIPSTTFCIPSTCSTEEFQVLVLMIFNLIGIGVTPAVAFCQVKESKEVNSDGWIMIGVLIALGAVTVAGSVLDIFLRQRKDNANLRKAKAIQALLAFSLPTNIQKWKNTSGDGGFGCIHGIRFFSTCWVLLSHTLFLYTQGGPVWNTFDLNEIYKRPWHFYLLLNAYFSVDSFFAMSGLLACYGILKNLEKTRGRLNVLKMYLHRYLRLTPTYALIIGVLATLFPYLGSGPYFTSYAEHTALMCRKHWWHNLLYMNNLWWYDGSAGDSMCEGESWYIANDMQFFIISPIFAFLLWKWELIGILVLSAASIASILTPGIVIGTEKLPPTQVFWKMGYDPNPRALEVYMQPWYRFGPYAVGMWMGYLLFKLGKRPVNLPKLGVIGGWLVSTASAFALLLGVIPYFDPENDDDPVWAGIYGGLSRFVWGMVICWVIFACTKGYGGWINDFLSWKVFVPLGRLTFCVYLSSLSVQTLLQLTVRQPELFTVYQMVNYFFSHVIMCFMVGFWLSMFFESPFIALERVIFARVDGEKRTPVTQETQEKRTIDPENQSK